MEQYTRFASVLFHRVRKGYDKSRQENALTILCVRSIIIPAMSDARSEYREKSLHPSGLDHLGALCFSKA